jgi:hypothetical protein
VPECGVELDGDSFDNDEVCRRSWSSSMATGSTAGVSLACSQVVEVQNVMTEAAIFS